MEMHVLKFPTRRVHNTSVTTDQPLGALTRSSYKTVSAELLQLHAQTGGTSTSDLLLMPPHQVPRVDFLCERRNQVAETDAAGQSKLISLER
jgi:hypothetical protein